MPAIACCVFAWSHQGRREGLFLELSQSYRIHFVRRTRRGNIAWGSCGNWNVQRSLNAANLHLQLRDFRCCEDARLWNIDFYVDPTNPSLMIDGNGREIRYLGRLVIMVYGPDVSRRMLALSEDDEEWMLL